MKGLFTSILLLLAGTLHAEVVAIRAGTVIDPAHGTSAKDQVILVEGGKIKAMGTGLAIPAGDLARAMLDALQAGQADKTLPFPSNPKRRRRL